VDLHEGPVIDHLVLEVGPEATPIAIRAASWRRALAEEGEDTAAAVEGRQAIVVRKTGEMYDAATFLEQIAGVER
jgi:hypothetical protein